MKEFFKKIHSDNFKWYDFSLLSLIITYAIMIVGSIIGTIIIGSIIMALSMINTNIKSGDPFVFINYVYWSFIGVWLLAFLVMLLSKPDRPIIPKLGTKEHGNNIKMLIIGLVIGFVMNISCALVAMLNKDIALYFNSFDPFKVLVVFIGVFIQSSAEEMACRGFLYQRLFRSYRHHAVAVVGNSVLFGLLHIFNDGVTVTGIVNVMLFGILCSLFVYFYDSIWCAMAIHAAWNFSQSILLGLPNSGGVFEFSIFKLDLASARNSFAYDINFGIEGTLVSCLVETAAILIVLYLGLKKKGQASESV
ncbi:CPBP family intramembrane metalloprotease [Butyrivibrio sp. X503]|uniref:CPBP family intramembrane glutamic endopeptidase n=1 Tax=Butyrivibrio sp. X503 TaxID=2364878 RepID=UPI000EAA5C56|nr:CPBP family intramembrane glutamic endopeptidase [Butyrivibrio sp. X503]RKM58334.1 CPBP family intramembrane metalloprotease [Butyrivibrio sp. X503]